MSEGREERGARAFAIVGPSPRSRLHTQLVALAIIAAVAAVVAAALADREAGLATLGAALVTVPLLAHFAARAARSRVVLDDEALRLEAPLATQAIPWRDLHVGGARVVDLAREPDLRPRWRLMGLGLVGWGSGWFSLRGGRDALVAAAYDAPAVLLPWGRGSLLLLTPQDPRDFLQDVRRRAAEGSRSTADAAPP